MTEIQTAEAGGAPNLPTVPNDFLAAMGSKPWIPAVQLVHSGSKVRTTWTPGKGFRKPQEGQFVYDDGKPLGQHDPDSCIGRFAGLVVALRAHALLIVNDDKKLESYDYHSVIYKRVQATKKQGMEVRPMFGGDVLLWLPDYKEFGIYFVHSTAKDRLPVFAEFKGKPITVSTGVAENKKRGYRWYIPEVTAYDGPAFDLPSDAELTAALAKWNEGAVEFDAEKQGPAEPGGVER